jgi:hypothetical protein
MEFQLNPRENLEPLLLHGPLTQTVGELSVARPGNG